MTVGNYIHEIVFIAGCVLIAILLLMAMWHFTTYVFTTGDDQERARAKKGLLRTTITLMFTMIFWTIISLIGYALGV